jgi:hypothetical protein
MHEDRDWASFCKALKVKLDESSTRATFPANFSAVSSKASIRLIFIVYSSKKGLTWSLLPFFK